MVDVNAGRKWLCEDVINLLELKDEGMSWERTAFILGRSENACRLRYGMIRFAHMLREKMSRIDKLVITKRIKQ